MSDKTVVAQIASALDAYARCIGPDANEAQKEYAPRHIERIDALVDTLMPSGSGFDCGTQFILDESKPNRLVFRADFHHMDEHGGYDGWTQHSVIVTPSLAFGFDLRITGRDRNNIKEYIAETFNQALAGRTE